MGNINIRYFASIRERLGRSGECLEISGSETVSAVWQRVSGDSLPGNILVAINQEYAQADAVVRAGDEVAFFPPVTGG